jgi:hypothetical protein
MAAKCQACVLRIPLIQTRVGTANDPLGVCTKCHCLVCGHHGHRDRSGTFLCIQCDSHLQGTSAGWNWWVLNQGAGPSGSPPPTSVTPDGDVGAELRAAFEGPGLAPLVVDSIEDWIARRPHYADLIELLRRDLARVVAGMNRIASDPDATLLGRSASDPRPGPARRAEFAALWHGMDERGRYLLAAALLIAQIMNLPASSLPDPLRDIAEIAGIILREDYPTEQGEIPFEESRYR